MTGFITPERVPNRRAEALGLDILPASGGEGFGAALEEAWVRNPGPSMLRQLNRARYGEPFGPEDPAGIVGYQRPKAGEDFDVLTPEQANEKYGIEGELKFDADTPEPVAKDLNRLKKEELQRQDVLRRAKSGLTTTISAGLIASIVDPVNVASAFFPVVGPARYASLVARQGAGRARATVGAIEGTVGAAVVEPAVYFTAQSEQADYNEVDSLVNLAFGTVLGAGLHLGAGSIGDRIQARAKASRLQREVDNLPRAEQEAILRTAAAQLFEDRPVRVTASLEAARQRMDASRRDTSVSESQQSRNLQRVYAGEASNRPIDLQQYTSRLYRETSIEGAEPLLPTSNTAVDTRIQEIHLTNVPELAIGQGSNRGVVLEFEAEGLQGVVNTSKPGLSAEAAEFQARRNTQPVYQRQLVSVTVKPDATARDSLNTRFKSQLAKLEELGFVRSENADGSVVYARGVDDQRPKQGAGGVSTPPRIVVERAIMDSIGDPHPEWRAATEAHTARAEAVKGEPRNLADEETAVTENLVEWEEQLTSEERTRLSDELKDDEKLTRNYEKAWRLGAVCRIKGNT